MMPARYIRVRKMKESETDQGDILAVAAAMEIIGASYVETLDTKGTDGSNVHLGGPATITGYFGGIGQPNEHALQWVDEALYYYTRYGIRQVLSINPGTVLLGYLLHKLGIDMELKISVFMGNDNPYSVLWTLMTARLFSRPDGSTPLIGFNLSNSVDAGTLKEAGDIRRRLGFEDRVRIEHHITETWKSIVRQPYNRAGRTAGRGLPGAEHLGQARRRRSRSGTDPRPCLGHPRLFPGQGGGRGPGDMPRSAELPGQARCAERDGPGADRTRHRRGGGAGAASSSVAGNIGCDVLNLTTETQKTRRSLKKLRALRASVVQSMSTETLC